MEPDNLALDRFILAAAGSPSPKVCFLPTASGDAQSCLDQFYRAFATLHCIPTHLSLFKPPLENLRDFVLRQEVIYVGGGNTRAMLALWREWDLDQILQEAWLAGVVMAGLSAGSLCWFEEGVSDSVRAGKLEPIAGLGLLQGSHCPHYDSEPERRPTYHRLLREGRLRAGYAADDGAALHFIGTQLVRVVSSRSAAKAYRVSAGDAEVKEEVLPADRLA